MDAINYLLQEHREIMAQVADLRLVARLLAEHGESALPEALPALCGFGRMMETRLALHAKKEDEALFPALEAVFGTEGTPTARMRMEHAEIHQRGEVFRQTLSELQQVEHPAIEASGERLRELIASGHGNAAALQTIAVQIIELIDSHFSKEEQILFPMAEAVLDPASLANIGEAMEDYR